MWKYIYDDRKAKSRDYFRDYNSPIEINRLFKGVTSLCRLSILSLYLLILYDIYIYFLLGLLKRTTNSKSFQLLCCFSCAQRYLFKGSSYVSTYIRSNVDHVVTLWPMGQLTISLEIHVPRAWWRPWLIHKTGTHRSGWYTVPIGRLCRYIRTTPQDHVQLSILRSFIAASR